MYGIFVEWKINLDKMRLFFSYLQPHRAEVSSIDVQDIGQDGSLTRLGFLNK